MYQKEQKYSELENSFSNKKILSALKGETLDVPPLWLMRQAGRYLTEYRDLRRKAGSFLDLCFSSELACEVTLQPIRRFDFDAAILFSDILVIPYALGRQVDYIEGKGPILQRIASEEEIEKLDTGQVTERLSPVFDTLSLVKEKLSSKTSLIGFAGAPWTVATYMVEGGGSKDFLKVKQMAYGEKEVFQRLIDVLVKVTVEYLSKQIEAGAEVIQLFDSWAGVLSEKEFERWVMQPTEKIISALKKKHSLVPVIGFPKGAGQLYRRYVRETGVDGVSIDSSVPLYWAAEELQPYVCLQGNLDPVLLAEEKTGMLEEVKRIKEMLGKGPFIFNLGHGVLPNTPVEHVEALVEAVRG